MATPFSDSLFGPEDERVTVIEAVLRRAEKDIAGISSGKAAAEVKSQWNKFGSMLSDALGLPQIRDKFFQVTERAAPAEALKGTEVIVVPPPSYGESKVVRKKTAAVPIAPNLASTIPSRTLVLPGPDYEQMPPIPQRPEPSPPPSMEAERELLKALSPEAPEPRGAHEKLFATLGAWARGAAGRHTVGDILAGAGGAGVAAQEEMRRHDREEDERYRAQLRAYELTRFQIESAHQLQQLAYRDKVAETRYANLMDKFNRDMDMFWKQQPNITVSGNKMYTSRQENGKTIVETTYLDEEMEILDRIYKQALIAKTFGSTATEVMSITGEMVDASNLPPHRRAIAEAVTQDRLGYGNPATLATARARGTEEMLRYWMTQVANLDTPQQAMEYITKYVAGNDPEKLEQMIGTWTHQYLNTMYSANPELVKKTIGYTRGHGFGELLGRFR